MLSAPPAGRGHSLVGTCQRSSVGLRLLLLIPLIFAGLTMLEAIGVGLSACSPESLISLGPEAGCTEHWLLCSVQAQECTIWLTVPSLIAVLALIKPSAPAEWKLQKGAAGDSAIPRTPVQGAQTPLNALIL